MTPGRMGIKVAVDIRTRRLLQSFIGIVPTEL
jgi:hypothetical protein